MFQPRSSDNDDQSEATGSNDVSIFNFQAFFPIFIRICVFNCLFVIKAEAEEKARVEQHPILQAGQCNDSKAIGFIQALRIPVSMIFFQQTQRVLL